MSCHTFRVDRAHAFRLQSFACGRLGSDLYRRLLDAAAEDLENEGDLSDIVQDWEGDPVADALPLRLMAAVHRLALRGDAPALAMHLPSTGGRPTWPGCTAEFFATVRRNRQGVRTALGRPPQTNEIGRAGVLLGGLLEIGSVTRQPVRILEIGASAGLNLLVDRFRYRLGELRYGDPDSPVVIDCEWRGKPPSLDVAVDIVERRGCDLAPLDVADPDDTDRLRSYVWADQVDRLERLTQAIALARWDPPILDKRSAGEWLAEQLDKLESGVSSVVMQSVVTQYMDADERREVMFAVREAGTRATRRAPVCWLRLEPARKNLELRLSIWPQDVHLTLAEAQAHGLWADWLTGAEQG